MRHTIFLSLTLAAFWLLNSGHNTLFLLSLGVVSIITVLYITHIMHVVDEESQPLHLTFKLPAYYAWLFKEVVLENISVVKKIWLGNQTISPALITLQASQKTDIGKVVYATSITLTPGTVAVSIDNDKIVVHALSRKNIEALNSGEMNRRVNMLEN
jgi:multicomponent Na+:H+ antiporter subunit E